MADSRSMPTIFKLFKFGLSKKGSNANRKNVFSFSVKCAIIGSECAGFFPVLAFISHRFLYEVSVIHMSHRLNVVSIELELVALQQNFPTSFECFSVYASAIYPL